jgi:hypothetical protein
MTIRATHELHTRRRGRNLGVALSLVAFAAILFGLTVVKVDTTGTFEAFDHVLRPGLVPTEGEGAQ